MNVGVYIPRRAPVSFQIVRDNLVRELEASGVDMLPFDDATAISPHCDIVWIPGSGTRAARRILKRSAPPVVVTFHGAVMFSVPILEAKRTWSARADALLRKRFTAYNWRRIGEQAAAVVAVSSYSLEEAVAAFRLPRTILSAIHHGIDHSVFNPDGEAQPSDRPYLLHVSARDQPKKNLARMLAAYARLPEHRRPELVAIVPGLASTADIPGVRLIREQGTQDELARWYRGALGFIFPSLHETFGMPILEAMACGCPVITSNVTACPEIAGDAALLVDPRSVDNIFERMRCLVEDDALRLHMRRQGLARARAFTWRSSAEGYRDLFDRILTSGRR